MDGWEISGWGEVYVYRAAYANYSLPKLCFALPKWADSRIHQSLEKYKFSKTNDATEFVVHLQTLIPKRNYALSEGTT